MQSTEEIIFAHGNVQVTKSRLVVGSSVYAIRNITRVRGLEEYPGCFRLFGSTSTYMIVLSTSSGEITAYTTKDKAVAGDLLEAIETAMARN